MLQQIRDLAPFEKREYEQKIREAEERRRIGRFVTIALVVSAAIAAGTAQAGIIHEYGPPPNGIIHEY